MWSFPGSYANRGSGTEQASSDVADRVGFEPTSLLRDYLISSQGRYDHFDTCPCSICRCSAIIADTTGNCKDYSFRTRKTRKVLLQNDDIFFVKIFI